MSAWIFLLNGLVEGLIVAYGISTLLRGFTEKHCPLARLLGLLGIFFAPLAIVHWSWLFGSFSYSLADQVWLTTLSLSITVLLLALFVHTISGKMHVLILLSFYVVGFLALLIALRLPLTALWLSSVFLVLLFLELAFVQHDILRTIGIVGAAYGLGLILVSLLTLLGQPLWLFIPDALLLIVLILFPEHMKLCESAPQQAVAKLPGVVQILKFGLFMFGLTVFIFFGALAVHETAHAVLAQRFDCEHRIVFHEQGLWPHTSVQCADTSSKGMILVSGFIITTAFALMFYVVGSGFIQNLSGVIFALGIVLANDDFAELGLSGSLVFAADILAGILLGIMFVRIVLDYLEERKTPRVIFCEGHCSHVER